MNDFIVDSTNSNGLSAVFEDDGETGYLYIYEADGAGVIDDLQIYSNSSKSSVKEKDVEIVWSKDMKKCGVKIWGNFYGIFNTETGDKFRTKLVDNNSSPITDSELLSEFA